jgi:hypothetical protein
MIILAIVSFVALVFVLVVFIGAPYLPTLNRQSKVALELLDLKPGETLIELGSGDGRMLKAAAQKGLHAVGYEINPFLILISWLYTWKYRTRVRIIWGNYWSRPWPKADGVYVFLISNFMKKLDKKLVQYPHKPLKVASFAFKIPGKKPRAEKDGVLLYIYK